MRMPSVYQEIKKMNFIKSAINMSAAKFSALLFLFYIIFPNKPQS